MTYSNTFEGGSVNSVGIEGAGNIDNTTIDEGITCSGNLGGQGQVNSSSFFAAPNLTVVPAPSGLLGGLALLAGAWWKRRKLV